MAFSNEQYYEAIKNNEPVRQAFTKIKEACQALQSGTNCPDEDIDDFLRFIISTWKTQ